ncbi:MAG TPA: 3-dehydroquinate synthase family protein, partial [Candidatus Cloacimonadota bacterium]|nr:3-dehydroquinate synthase family protein [Candidatus Cloacimonadota bacterium]
MIYNLRGKLCEIVFTSEMEFPDAENYAVIGDNNVLKLHASIFKNLRTENVYLFRATETTKDFAHLENILSFLKERNIHRNSMIYGIGGGITTDIAALSASLFKRGCRLTLIPTTVLSMVDAAVGGKTGINFAGIKNGVGTFFPAEKIIISADFLPTLAAGQLLEGRTEIVKMSFLPESNLANLFSENAPLPDLIREAVNAKMRLCVIDPEDRKERRLLNLGHTFGHVLESTSNYTISHGNAIAVGMRAAALFSRQKEFISEQVYRNIVARLDQNKLPENFPARTETGEQYLKLSRLFNAFLRNKLP